MSLRESNCVPRVEEAIGPEAGRRYVPRVGYWSAITIIFLQLVLLSAADADFLGRGVEDGGHLGASSIAAASSTGAGGAGSEGVPIQTGGESARRICDEGQTFDVLFIGNSYTHYFEMPQLLAGMAESAGCRLNASMVAPGGVRLADHAQSGETLSAIGSRDWDAVVLQNFSQLPSQAPEDVRQKTFEPVEVLVDAIVQNDPSTSIYYFVTWGRRDGDQEFCASNKLVCSFEGHTEALQRGYSLYANHFKGSLANVGAAWARASGSRRAPFSREELYDRDGSHPSLRGSYLTASVFFATFFHASPEGLSHPRGLSAASASFLQRVAATMPYTGA